jgi:hypothetical protein
MKNDKIILLLKIYFCSVIFAISIPFAFADLGVEYQPAINCNKETKSSPSTTVILAMTERLGDAGVLGATADIDKMKAISQVLHGDSKVELIKPGKLDIKSETLKESTLFHFKKIKEQQEKNGGGDIHLMYSGHGALCVDPITKIEHWCINAGVDPHPITFDQWKDLNDREKMKYMESEGENQQKEFLNKNFLITEEEIMNILHPKTMFLDSCHSGKVADMLINQKNQISNQEGVFVFAASMSHQKALGSQWGGAMTSAVFNFVKGMKEDVACMMDWEGNGEISDRAISVAAMLAFTPKDSQLSSVDLKNPERQSRGTSFKQTDDMAQMVASNPVGKCFMKHKFSCPPKKMQPPNKTNPSQCESLANKFLNISENINNMIKNRDIFREYRSIDFETDGMSRGLAVTKDKCKSDAARGLRTTGQNDCEQDSAAPVKAEVPEGPCDSTGARGLSVTKCSPPSEKNAAMAFLSRFKNDIIKNYSDVCSKNNQETNCSKFSQDAALKMIDGLVDNMREVLFRQTSSEQKK